MLISNLANTVNDRPREGRRQHRARLAARTGAAGDSLGARHGGDAAQHARRPAAAAGQPDRPERAAGLRARADWRRAAAGFAHGDFPGGDERLHRQPLPARHRRVHAVSSPTIPTAPNAADAQFWIGMAYFNDKKREGSDRRVRQGRQKLQGITKECPRRCSSRARATCRSGRRPPRTKIFQQVVKEFPGDDRRL